MRPTMRFTQVRTPEQVDLQALHRIRDQLVSNRTRLINQMRAFCLEYGVAFGQGAGLFRRDLPGVLADDGNDLTPAMRRILGELFADLERLDQRIATATREIEGLAARDDRARRLMTIPGFGPLAATALLAAMGDGRQFRRGRDLAAWLGLVPRECSTGGKTTLLGISKRGNRYVATPSGSRSPIVRDPSRSDTRSPRRLARRTAGQDACEQGHRCACRQDRPRGMGDHHQAGRALRTQGSGRRLSAAPRQKARLGKVMTKQSIGAS